MLAFLAATAMAGAFTADTAIGEWRSPTKNAIVRISACGNSLCGTLLASDDIAKDPNRKDFMNKKPELRNRPLKGITMIGGFKQKGNQWVDGWVYKADEGNTYSGSITIVDKDHIKLTGCVVAPLCKTQTWTRVK